MLAGANQTGADGQGAACSRDRNGDQRAEDQRRGLPRLQDPELGADGGRCDGNAELGGRHQTDLGGLTEQPWREVRGDGADAPHASIVCCASS